jgi:hypothetical protein
VINYSNECYCNCVKEIAIIFKDKEAMKESGRGRGGITPIPKDAFLNKK